MRAVLDTNVLVSGLLTPDGPPGRVLQAFRDGAFEVVTSAVLLEELSTVLDRPRIRRRSSAGPPDALVAALAGVALVVQPTQPARAFVDDPADDALLEAAIAGRAEYVVSGDRAILALTEFAGVSIVTPARFLAILQTRSIGDA